MNEGMYEVMYEGLNEVIFLLSLSVGVNSLVQERWGVPVRCSCGGLSGARCLDCMASLIESDVSRECDARVLLIC